MIPTGTSSSRAASSVTPAMRHEDHRLLAGHGRYTSDIELPRMVYAVFVRSEYAHARITAVKIDGLEEIPGLLGVFTAKDLEDDGLSTLPQDVPLQRPNGCEALSASRPILAGERTRHVGEAVALVVAETAAAAAEAAEGVLVEYEELPFVASLEEALEGKAVVWADAADNIGVFWKGGDVGAVEKALAEAALVVREEFRISRVAASPMETRAAIGEIASDGRMVLYVSHQQPQALRGLLAWRVFGVPIEKVRVVVPDVGGSFGLKTGIHPEEVAVLWAARRVDRPVKWISSRSESLLADDQSRDVRLTGALALNENGDFTALQVRADIDVGAYLSARSVATVNNIGGIAGVYRTPAICAEIYGVMTNTVPTGPYRGAGRPEATFAIERLIDIAAKEFGVSGIELRQRNLIPPSAMPYKTALTFTYDSGDFAANMERMASLAQLSNFEDRRREAAERGRLRGLGIANLIESAGGPFGRPTGDRARLRLHSDGAVVLDSGAVSTGQGLETALAALVADKLGISADRVRYFQGDTDRMEVGRGSGGSSAIVVSGTTTALAVDRVIEEGCRIAADHFEAAPEDIRYEQGRFSVVGTDRIMDLEKVAALAEARSPNTGLSAEADFQPSQVTFPNGCHACELEIDPETGMVELIRYVSVEDIGCVLEPVLVEGQMHGGIAQGISQALGEAMVHDPESGQVLTGSFMDYEMLRADRMPRIISECHEVPTKVNSLGAKGVGEAGTVGALVTTINAVCDALAPLGIRHFDMPATPARVWEAIHQAEGSGCGET